MLSVMEIEEMKERERLQTIRESFVELATSETQERFIGHLETWKWEEKHNQGHKTISHIFHSENSREFRMPGRKQN